MIVKDPQYAVKIDLDFQPTIKKVDCEAGEFFINGSVTFIEGEVEMLRLNDGTLITPEALKFAADEYDFNVLRQSLISLPAMKRYVLIGDQ